VTRERLSARSVEVACQSGDSAEHLKWRDVEIGAFASPRGDQLVYLVARRH
jgi:hypothetical protein